MTRVKTVGKPKTKKDDKPKYDWRYENSINKKTNHIDISKETIDYSAWRTNTVMSNFIDTIMYANMMNINHGIPDQMQYDFYYYGVRKNKDRFFKKEKNEEDKTDFTLVQEFYKYNNERTREALRILSPEQINEIKRRSEKGGIK